MSYLIVYISISSRFSSYLEYFEESRSLQTYLTGLKATIQKGLQRYFPFLYEVMTMASNVNGEFAQLCLDKGAF